MVVQPPSVALEPKAQLSPSEQLQALAMRSDNPVKRAIDVMCVILLQLLILLVLVDEKDLEKRRTCYVLAPDSILTKLEQGFDFGLPMPIAAAIRLAVRLLRAEYNLGQDYIDWLTTADTEAPATIPAPRGCRPRRVAKRRPHHPTPQNARLAQSHHPRPVCPARPEHPPPFVKNAFAGPPPMHVDNVPVKQQLEPAGLDAGPSDGKAKGGRPRTKLGPLAPAGSRGSAPGLPVEPRR